MPDSLPSDLLSLTSAIISSLVSHNAVSPHELPPLIHDVYRALASAGTTEAAPVEQAQEPAVPIKRSVFPDHIICLEDGRKLKMLKRHLRTSYDMSPDEYRAKWGLPASYPMVAPEYASRRSELAKEAGLGRVQ